MHGAHRLAFLFWVRCSVDTIAEGMWPWVSRDVDLLRVIKHESSKIHPESLRNDASEELCCQYSTPSHVRFQAAVSDSPRNAAQGCCKAAAASPSLCGW